MTKYLLLGEGGKMPETEAETEKVMKEWGAWYESLGSALVDPGNPMSPIAKISSGSVSDSVGSMTNGYIIIQAESNDEAVKLAQGCPMVKDGGEISVFQTFDVM